MGSESKNFASRLLGISTTSVSAPWFLNIWILDINKIAQWIMHTPGESFVRSSDFIG